MRVLDLEKKIEQVQVHIKSQLNELKEHNNEVDQSSYQ